MSLRFVAAAAVLASVAIHLILWFQGMRDVHVIGPAFLVNVGAGILIAALLLRWRHWVPGALAACFGLATLGAFTLASTVGLFGDHEKWQGLSVFGAATAEIVAILVGLTLVLEEPAETSAPVRSEPQTRSGGVSNRSERA